MKTLQLDATVYKHKSLENWPFTKSEKERILFVPGESKMKPKGWWPLG